MADLPTSDDFFGAAPQQGALPTANDFFAPPQPGPVATTFNAVKSLVTPNFTPQGAVNQSEALDAFFKKTAAGRIANAFFDNAGETFAEGGQLGLSDETAESMRKSGIFNDYAQGQQNFGKAMNEALIRPAATGMDFAMRTASALYSGAQNVVAQTGAELGYERAGRDIASIPDMLMGHGPGSFDVHPLPKDIAAAKDVGVLDSEAAYMGTVSRTPEQEAAARQAVAQARPEQAVTTEAPADIHEAARAQAPDAFEKYDTIDAEKSSIRDQINDAAERGGKNPEEIAALNSRLEELDKQQRELSPEVKEAYSTADQGEIVDPEVRMAELERQIDSGTLTPEQKQSALDEMAKNQEAATQKYGNKIEAPDIEAQKSSIANDVTQKLTDAGRPPGEAQAAAQLVAEHYQARSERFNGEAGTAQEMYKRDAPNIRAGKNSNKAKQAAQGARGSLQLKEAKNTITLMKSANASTFIHETGHHWLDEMMRDAADPKAPDGLKNDASAVRKWLGVSEDADFRAERPSGRLVLSKEHEKFARGFERYMMEGTAPSKQLASVFAKFKDWLTSIYQTVGKLRAPISNDIRDVFDRLLSSNPEKTVIASDARENIIANFHEAQAEHTPPAKAAEVRDNVRLTVDRVLEAQAPEVYDAVKQAENAVTEVSSEAGGDTAGGGIGEQPAAEGATGQSREVNPSGSDAGAEGGAIREPKPDSGSAEGGDRSKPNGANDRFPRADTRLVDKAGNIRLDNLNTPEDINEVLRQTAEENDNFQGVRGPVSDGQVLDLADAMGVDPAFIDRMELQKAGMDAASVVALRKLLIQSAGTVRDAMLKAADGTDADVIAYGEVKARHQMIQEKLSAKTAEAGRVLRAFREMEGSQDAKALGDFLKENTGSTLFQLQREAKLGSKLQTTQQISKFVGDSSKKSFRDMFLEYYINSLISGPFTHARYSAGNALNALWTPLVETPIAAGMGAGRELLTGVKSEDRVYMGEAGAQLYAIGKGSREGLRAAVEAFKSGVSPSLPGERLSENAFTSREAIPGTFGKVMRLPSKSVSAIHSFFKSLRYEQNIHAQAYRQAMSEGLSKEEFSGRVAQLVSDPSEEMMHSATKDALKELYMSPTEYHSAMGALTRFTNQNLAAKIVMPFMKIGSQITRNAFIERTPLGVFDKEVRANLLGKNGDAARDFQMGKIAAGTSLVGVMSLATMEGLATGDGPSDPAQRRVWLLNHRPNTITVGNVTLPYQGLGGLGMLMRFSANMTETAHGWGEEDGDKLAFSALEGLTKSVLDDNFMRGLKDMLDAVYHPEEYGSQYVRGMATNFIPFSIGMGQTARATDPYSREVHNIFDAARNKIPGLSESLQPRRDMFGEPIPNGGSVQNYENDKVVQRMDALNIGVGKLEQKIRNVPLTPQQYDDFSALAGRFAKTRLDAIVSPAFAELPEPHQREIIHKTIDQARESARKIIMMENPDIPITAMKNKIAGVKK